MKYMLVLSAFIAPMLLSNGDAYNDRSEQVCADRSNANATGFEAYVRNLMSSPRAASSRARRGLEAVHADSVNLVFEPGVCARADSAVASIDTVPRAGERVLYVVRAGAEYWVEDPRVLAGEYTNGFVFDTAFTRLIRRNFR